MSRALLTGASGFVGAVLARRLVADGHEVSVLVRPAHDPWRLRGLEQAVSIESVDLSDRAAVARVVGAARPDWVFHLAASGAYSWQKDLREMLSTNLAATVNLLEASLEAGCRAFVHAGSSSEYGFKSAPPAEDTWLEPNSHYAVTKAAATLYCRSEAMARQAPVRVLRLYTIYGPYEDPRRFVPTLIVHGLEGRLPVLVDPRVARDMVYVDDAVEAFVRAAVTPGQEPGAVYNIGSGRQTTIGEAVAIARRVMGIGAEPVWGSMPNRAWDTSCWVADARRAERCLGWTARTGLEDGLRQSIAWLERSGLLDLYRERRA